MPPVIPIARHGAGFLELLPSMANRHGLITGATGTGKTITLQTLAEGFSACGVPVFLADVKGDLAGMAFAGGGHARVAERVERLGLTDWRPEGVPVTLWDVFGEAGHPVRTTVSEMGPLLLGRLLDLNETQAGVLQMAFRIADDHGLLLLDLKDLQSMLRYVGEHGAAFTTRYGNVSAASIGAIQRALLSLESQGADRLFGEPALDLDDLLQTVGGRGVVNVLAADRLMAAPRVYATLLLWLLNELFEGLPEVGDPERPRLVFFFDEAHLLFREMPAALLEKIETVVRLIRSKGVGVYFVTQSPGDIPDRVLGQLGNRVQHALRAFTPAEQKVVRAAAGAFRPNPAFDTASVIGELGVGEALVSLLDGRGQPGVVERAWVLPPRSRIGPATAAERAALRSGSLVAGVYEAAVDRESAHERLASLLGGGGSAVPEAGSAPERKGFLSRWFGGGDSPKASESAPAPELPSAPTRTRTRRERDDLGDLVTRTATRTLTTAVAGALGRELARGLLGGLLGGGGRKRRRR